MAEQTIDDWDDKQILRAVSRGTHTTVLVRFESHEVKHTPAWGATGFYVRTMNPVGSPGYFPTRPAVGTMQRTQNP